MNCAAGAGVEPAISRVKADSPTADGASRNGAVSRCRPGSPALQGQGHSRVRRQGTGASDGGRFRFTDQQAVSVLTPVLVSSVRFERTLPSASCGLLVPLPWGCEDVEPPPGADPGHPPYEGGAAAVRGGIAAGQGLEP